MDKPEQELKGFAKTRLLQPGESQSIAFELDGRALASFDAARAAWVAEPGTYTVRIGASSRDIRAEATFMVEEEVIVETVTKTGKR
mgnify:FL=1